MHTPIFQWERATRPFMIRDCITPYPIGPLDCGQTDNPIFAANLATLATRYTELGGRIGGQFPGVPALISEYPNPLDNGAGQPCQGDDYNATAEVGFLGESRVGKQKLEGKRCQESKKNFCSGVIPQSRTGYSIKG